MNLRGHFMSQKRTLKTWGRRGRGQIKNACAQDQKGEEWGAAQQPSSEGRERRRRRAEDVGVVLGEAARVRDVRLFHQIADVGPELRRRAARAPVLGEERRRRRQEQVVVDGRRGPRRPRARARRRRLEAGLEVRRADGVVLAREGDGQRGLVADAVEAAAQRRLDRRRRRRLGAAEGSFLSPETARANVCKTLARSSMRLKLSG